MCSLCPAGWNLGVVVLWWRLVGCVVGKIKVGWLVGGSSS